MIYHPDFKFYFDYPLPSLNPPPQKKNPPKNNNKQGMSFLIIACNWTT